jgi:tetratricopeptide (TPR) repeat protein
LSKKSSRRERIKGDGKPARPHDFQGILNEAIGHANARRMGEAEASYRRLLALQPGFAAGHFNLGVALAGQEKFDGAIKHYQRAITLDPKHAEANNNLGVLRAAQGRLADAVALYERAIAIKPEYAEAHNNLGAALAELNRLDEAAVEYERAIALDPRYPEAHNNLGVLRERQGRVDEAVGLLERALTFTPDSSHAHTNLGIVFAGTGRFNDAMTHYNRAIELDPLSADAYYYRTRITTYRAGDNDVAAMEDLAARNLPLETASNIRFALARAYELKGDYERSFAYLLDANSLKRRTVRYDEPEVMRSFRNIAASFSREILELLEGAGDPSETPVFVLGMPRSGSTLIEQILASHPQIHGAGELIELDKAADGVLGTRNQPVRNGLDLDALDQIARTYLASVLPTAGKTRVVDKLPENFLRIGLIHLIFPNAKIIHTMRDPVDTCLSCFSTRFAAGQAFSYDLGELGRYYRAYVELMAHWQSVLPPGRILDVVYEDVVEDLEGQARRLIEYCGLEWDDRCLSFHQTNRIVRTASAVQVRQPLFRSSMQRWRKYEPQLAPLLRELGSLAEKGGVGQEAVEK